MLNIPEEIKELFKKDRLDEDTIKKIKIEFFDSKIETLYPYETLFPEESLFPAETGTPWLIIENNRLVSESVKLTEFLCSGSDIDFGACCSAQLEFTCADVAEDITGREFVVSIEVGGYQMAFGIYTVFSANKQADKRFKDVIAYDKMLWFDTDVSYWYNNLSFPLSVKQFRTSLCEYIGVSQEPCDLVNDGMTVIKTIEPTEISGRDVLRCIGEINGVFSHFDRTGFLKYISLKETGLYPSETLYPENVLYPSEAVDFIGHNSYRSIDYEEYTVSAIDALIVRQEDGDIGVTVGSGDNAYIIQGNFLAYGKSDAEMIGIATNIYNNISNRFYRPHKTVLNGLPYIEVGDGIQVQTSTDMIESFVFKRVLTGIQILKDEYSATGAEKRENYVSSSDKIKQLQGKTNKLNRTIDETRSELTDMGQNLESKIVQTAGEIRAEVQDTTNGLQSQITVNKNSIETKVTDVQNNLQGQITVQAGRIESKVGKGEIISSINQTPEQVSINASKINLNGVVTANNRFKILSDGSMEAVNGRFRGHAEIDTGRIGDDGILIEDNGRVTLGNGAITIEPDGQIFVGGFRLVHESDDTWILWGTYNQNMAIGNDGNIRCNKIEMDSTFYGREIQCSKLICNNDVYIPYAENGWMQGWGVVETLKALWRRVDNLES